MPICDNCGTGLPVGYDYCFKCGYPVRGLPSESADAAGAAAQQPPPPQPVPFVAAPPIDAPPAFGYAPPSAHGAPVATGRLQVLATWNARFVAALIDYVLVSMVVGAVFFVTGAFNGSQNLFADLGSNADPKLELLVIAFIACFFAYNVICELAFRATLGKRLLSLQVVAYGGGPAGLGRVVMRNLTKSASCVVWPIGVPLALFVIASNPNHQRLGDQIGHTYVLREVATVAPPGVLR